jgi:hypothetical protein
MIMEISSKIVNIEPDTIYKLLMELANIQRILHATSWKIYVLKFIIGMFDIRNSLKPNKLVHII